MRVWDASDYFVKTEAIVVGDASLEPKAVAYSFDGLYSGWSDGVIRCHNAETGKGKNVIQLSILVQV